MTRFHDLKDETAQERFLRFRLWVLSELLSESPSRPPTSIFGIAGILDSIERFLWNLELTIPDAVTLVCDPDHRDTLAMERDGALKPILGLDTWLISHGRNMRCELSFSHRHGVESHWSRFCIGPSETYWRSVRPVGEVAYMVDLAALMEERPFWIAQGGPLETQALVFAVRSEAARTVDAGVRRLIDALRPHVDLCIDRLPVAVPVKIGDCDLSVIRLLRAAERGEEGLAV